MRRKLPFFQVWLYQYGSANFELSPDRTLWRPNVVSMSQLMPIHLIQLKV